MGSPARFRYTAVSPDGRTLSGELDGRDKADLAQMLGGRGLILVSADRVRDGGGLLSSPADPRKVTTFLGELALMLRSGLPLTEALDLAARGAPARLARIIAALGADVLAGASFVQALDKHPAVFPKDLVAMARIAEATGDLDGMLATVAAQRERAQRLGDKLVGALRYPAFLVVSATGVLVFFLLQVIPQFKGLFSDSGRDPGAMVRFILALSDGLNDNLNTIAVGAVLCLLAGLLAWRTPAIRAALGALLQRLSLIRGTATLWRASRLLNGLAVLLGQGVPLTEALRVLEDLVGPAGRAPLAAVGDAVRRGGRLHEALSAVGLLPPVAIRMVRIGEETGELAKVVADASTLYSGQLEKRLDGVSALVGPIAILVIAGLIGGLMVTIMSALVSVDQAVL